VLARLLLAVAVGFGINLMPAFGPPTWAVLVFFRFRFPEVPASGLIVGGALAASAGRLLLALVFRAFGTKLPPKRQESLQVLGHALGEHRAGLLASFALFATAPLPSAQMFEAAGLARVRLRPLLAAFFLGRLVSYSIYVGAASAAHDSRQGPVLTGGDRHAARRRRRVDRHRSHRLAGGDRQGTRLVGDASRPTGPPPIRQSALPPVTPAEPKT
jgi:hypothetical protein